MHQTLLIDTKETSGNEIGKHSCSHRAYILVGDAAVNINKNIYVLVFQSLNVVYVLILVILLLSTMFYTF